jgi:hypothetical protein
VDIPAIDRRQTPVATAAHLALEKATRIVGLKHDRPDDPWPCLRLHRVYVRSRIETPAKTS